MKKIILLTFFTLLFLPAHSQDPIEDILKEINITLEKYGANPDINQVYLNREKKILDFDNFQIPLLLTETEYEAGEKIYEGKKIVGKVFFECEYNCIEKEDKKYAAIGYGFKTKEAAYLFMDLLYKLEKELTNEN